MIEFLVAALGADMDRLGIVQTEHSHKAFTVDALVIVADRDFKGLHGGKGNEVLDFFKRMNSDIEFLHPKAS